MPLKRVLGAGDAGLLVAGNMIGAGIFVTPGLVGDPDRLDASRGLALVALWPGEIGRAHV